jgi:hypothetical protein
VDGSALVRFCDVGARSWTHPIKSRAALAGQSLSEYALAELIRAAERPTRQEVLARIRSRQTQALAEQPADLVRAERER